MKSRGASSELHRSLFSRKCFEVEAPDIKSAPISREQRPQSCGRAGRAVGLRGGVKPLDAIKSLSPHTDVGSLTDRPNSSSANNAAENQNGTSSYTINDRGNSCQGYITRPPSSARGRIKTNASLFPSRDEVHDAMPIIPISPMFTQRTENSAPNWGSDFFGRGATAIPSSRHQKSTSENPLPGLLNSASLEDRLRKTSNKRPITSTRVQASATMGVNDSRLREKNLTPPSSGRNSFNLAVSPIDPPSVLQKTILPSAQASRLNKQRSRSTSRAAALQKSTRQNLSQEEGEVEPWAFKIISKYNSDPSQRPLSRCTSRVKSQECLHVNGPQVQTYSSKSTPSLHSLNNNKNVTVTEFG